MPASAAEFIPVTRDGDAPTAEEDAAGAAGAVRALVGRAQGRGPPAAPPAAADDHGGGGAGRRGYLSFVSSRASYDVTVTTLSAAPPGPVNTAGNRVVEVTASGLVAGDGPYTC